jgi:hypothetical protein
MKLEITEEMIAAAKGLLKNENRASVRCFYGHLAEAIVAQSEQPNPAETPCLGCGKVGPGFGYCHSCAVRQAAPPEVTTDALDNALLGITANEYGATHALSGREASAIRDGAEADILANLARQAESYARERATDKARIAELQTTVDGRGRIIAELESECSRRAARNATLAGERDELLAEADTLRTALDRESCATEDERLG